MYYSSDSKDSKIRRSSTATGSGQCSASVTTQHLTG